MPNAGNVTKLEEYREMINGMKGMVVVDYRGITVAEVQDFRQKAREAGVEYHVIKNRIMKIAFADDEALSSLNPMLVNTRAIALSKTDEVSAAKVVCDFAKKNEKMKVITGYLDGDVLSIPEIEALAKLPSKDELLAQIAADIQAPTQYIASGLNAVIQKLAIAVSEIQKQKEQASA